MYSNLTLYAEWMRELWDELQGPPNSRKVIWFHDPDGGAGKTTFAKYMIANGGDGVSYCRAGRRADVAMVLPAVPKIVMLDVARDSQSSFSYELLEELKDGLVFASKYESKMLMFETPHVVVFSNWLPDYSKLSLDRWDIRRICKEE